MADILSSPSEAPVLVVNMPFFTLHSPSRDAGLLKAFLKERGVETHVRYLNLEFGSQADLAASYLEVIESTPEAQFDEWLCQDAFGRDFDAQASSTVPFPDQLDPALLETGLKLRRRLRDFLVQTSATIA